MSVRKTSVPTPLIQMVVFELDFSTLDRKKNVECPWDQKPDHRHFFFGNGFQYPLGFNSFKNDTPGTDNEIAEPVHFGTGVVKRRDAQKIVFVGLIVVAVFDVAGMFQVAMGQKDRFGLAGCSGGEIQGGTVVELGYFINRLV